MQPRFLLVLGAALVVGLAIGILVARSDSTTSAAPTGPSVPTGPAATWAAGARPAPDFSLTDQAGDPVSLARFRGRPVIVTFIDPLCRNLCPLEARVLARAEASVPKMARPAIVAVSVNQWGNARGNLVQDVAKWRLGHSWYWAVGRPRALAKVWRDYKIGVLDTPKRISGITVHQISHTEASYVLDAKGDERALFLYPFGAADLARTLRHVAGV